jgi:hypothetical protein
MQSIEILPDDFRIGENDPITAALVFTLLKLIAGHFGTLSAPTYYARFEDAIVSAAHEIAGKRPESDTPVPTAVPVIGPSR